MNYGPVQSWLNRLLEIAVLLVVVGLLLNWAWQLIRPLVPIIAVTAGLSAVVTLLVRRNRSW
jgi:hypothetical protein